MGRESYWLMGEIVRENVVFIGETAAISVARQAGLEPGLGAWRTHSHWYGGVFNTYVWTVDNTLTADEPTGRSSGRTGLIDANSGSVLQILGREVLL